MNRERATALALRQQLLRLRSTELRGRLAADAAVLQPALVVVAVLRPRRVWRWGWKLWWGWRTLRRLQRRLYPVR